MSNNILADALSAIKNAERVGKEECAVVNSKLIRDFLGVIKSGGYIESFEESADKRKITVRLSKRINDMNVITPRFSVGFDEMDKWERRFLPAKGFGALILTTSKGVMDNSKAKEQKTGGKLLGFVY